MFSQTAEYALRAVVWLASQESGQVVGVETISNATQIPTSYLAKLMRRLVAAEIVESRRGVQGGFLLTQDPAKLTVLEVINCVDPIDRFEDCPLKLASHKKRRCPMHAKMNLAIEEVQRVLGESTILELLNDKTRPTPLLD